MDLIPINEHLEDNKEFFSNPLCQESLYMTIAFFKKVGYKKPWISYYAMKIMHSSVVAHSREHQKMELWKLLMAPLNNPDKKV